MKLLLYEGFARFAIPRMLYFAILGIVLFAIPSFVLDGTFYAVVGYLALAGILRLVFFIRNIKDKHLLGYASLAVSVILIIFCIISLMFARYLVHMSPLYLGAMLLVEGCFYFIIALCAPGGLQRSFLIVLSMIVLLGGAVAVVFTLGFGVDGMLGLTRVSGTASILSGVYALVAYLFYQKTLYGTWKARK